MAEAERLLGAEGSDVRSRLGLSVEATPEDVTARLRDAIGRWRSRAENPLSGKDQVEASLVLARSGEGMLAALEASP
jgi:hypothetical protein